VRILVADKFEQSGLDGLQSLGNEVLYEPDLKEQPLAVRIKEVEPEALVVRSTKVERNMIEGSSLKLIIRAGAGYNTIDVTAATNSDIRVANCPGKNAAAVAELAFGLIIACDRRIPDNVFELRQGRWNKKGFSKAQGLHGRTLGLVGLGNIGREMVAKAKAFGMVVLAYSSVDAVELGVEKVSTVEELAARSDVVSVHTSLRSETRGLLGESFFAALRPGAIFVNTSRAEVVDQAALLQATDAKSLWVGLDVFDDEPSSAEGTYEGPLRNNPRVYCTHHIGASTEEAQEAVAAEVVRIVMVFETTGEVPNCVNPAPVAAGA
jgi:D-3-phosphoglycerate dehydrogenase / 2-oxoglutarate reductase